MFYTLMKGLLWVLLALGIGIVTGWFLREVAAKRQIARARANNVGTAESERLRSRTAELDTQLEQVRAERDRLRDALAACQAGDDVGGGAGAAADPAARGEVSAVASLASLDTVGVAAPQPPNVSGAAAVLGRSIDADDLKVVEGIGPKIEQLCQAIGIRTWRELAETEVSLLRTMLADAGSRFRAHDPETWPRQAALLADGRWDEFKVLTDQLRGGTAR